MLQYRTVQLDLFVPGNVLYHTRILVSRGPWPDPIFREGRYRFQYKRSARNFLSRVAHPDLGVCASIGTERQFS